jgi:hypothetical protein
MNSGTDGFPEHDEERKRGKKKRSGINGGLAVLEPDPQ